MKKLKIDEFIKRSKEIHDDYYDYSKVEYVNNRTKVCIICPEHGEFWQTPNSHLDGHGCKKCVGFKISEKKKYNLELFIDKANIIHFKKYFYDKVEYINSTTKVCIVCPEHGEFWQTPAQHLHGSGCPSCSNKIKGQHQKITIENFIKKSREIHGDKYDYSKVNYINANTKVCIICPEHGEFWQTPSSHTNGKQGCKQCYGNFKLTNEIFISKAKIKHGNKYDYSMVNYDGNKKKVCIICPEHGEFWQRPNDHLSGRGCPKCNISNLEKEIMELLIKHKINHIYQARKKDLDELHFLGRLTFDFYIPDKKIAIECQGKQHFITECGWGNNFESLNIIQDRDRRKKELCEKHDIKLLYYSKVKLKFPYKVYDNTKEIINEILK